MRDWLGVDAPILTRSEFETKQRNRAANLDPETLKQDGTDPGVQVIQTVFRFARSRVRERSDQQERRWQIEERPTELLQD
jgi:hypothetical protein